MIYDSTHQFSAHSYVAAHVYIAVAEHGFGQLGDSEMVQIIGSPGVSNGVDVPKI